LAVGDAACHRMSGMLLPYREPGETGADLPDKVPALLLCAPPLGWFGMTAVALGGFVDLDGDSFWIPGLWMSALCCGPYVFRRYWRGRKPWYVVTCLALNGVTLALCATPLVLLWAWALIVMFRK
jgi:hypothetical protein